MPPPPRSATRGRNRSRWRAISDRKSTRLNSSHGYISYAVFCLKKKKCIHNRAHGKADPLFAPARPSGHTQSDAADAIPPFREPTIWSSRGEYHKHFKDLHTKFI